ncbi:DUF2254 family protein [Morganella morganii]|jgi:uncharacterized membrane protein|uniref:DUF2254 family protein n=1 Tax=Morganella TaxID=581 RepID=UPI00370CA37E
MSVPLLGGLDVFSGINFLPRTILSPEPILNILATSLLTVTTFSLGIIVSTYSSVSNQASPRATILITKNPTILYVLSTFIGSFLYSLVGVIGVYSDFYTPTGKFFVLFVTVGVLIIVIIAFVRWINHLFVFGRVNYITSQLLDVTSDALMARKPLRSMGARLSLGPPPSFPQTCQVYSMEIGFIQYIDIKSLNSWAKNKGGHIYIGIKIGYWVNLSHLLLTSTVELSDSEKKH